MTDINKKILIFGDSFIGPFTLLKDNRYIITKFKGGTLKGIIKQNNENHIKMMKIINKYKNNIGGIIFFFGSVDIHFSYYYNNLFKKEKNNSISEIKQVIKKYYSMILKISNKFNNIKITIINPFINPIDKDFKLNVWQLLNYRIITHNDLNIQNMKIINNNIKNANKFFFKYSEILYKTFKLNNSNNNIKYINFNKETITNINNPLKAKIKKEYKDYSKTNIHLLYKPVLLLFLNKILYPIYNIKYNKKQIDYFLKYENKYIKQKHEEIMKLINMSNNDLKLIFTNDEGQIDYYNAKIIINSFYDKHIKPFNNSKKTNHNKAKTKVPISLKTHTKIKPLLKTLKKNYNNDYSREIGIKNH
jgi:hypothetical protein